MAVLQSEVKQNRALVWTTVMKYLIHIRGYGYHFFLWPQWATHWALWQKNDHERANDCLCTLHMCAHTFLLNLTAVPKCFRWSVAQSHSTMCLPPPLDFIFPFPPCCKGKEMRQHSSSPSSVLPFWASTHCCSWAKAGGKEETTSDRGTAFPREVINSEKKNPTHNCGSNW